MRIWMSQPRAPGNGAVRLRMWPLQGPTCVPDRRCKLVALCAAFVADTEVLQEHAQPWNSELTPHVASSRFSAVKGVEAANSAWVADERNRVSGRELP